LNTVPFDEGLAHRIREAVGERPDVTEKRMFGGLAFLTHGRMFVGILGDALMARVGPDAYAQALARPHVREMDFTGRPMTGFVIVDPPGIDADRQLHDWVARALAFAGTLPVKPIAAAAKRRSRIRAAS